MEYHSLYDSSNIGDENANEAHMLLDRANDIESLLLADGLSKLNIQNLDNASCGNCSCGKKSSGNNFVPMNVSNEQLNGSITMSNLGKFFLYNMQVYNNSFFVVFIAPFCSSYCNIYR